MARTAPAVLGLLADSIPRPRAAVVAALAGRHAKEDVVRTLMRLAVTDRVDEAGGRYTLAAVTDPAPDEG
jgi:hypothetical protein